VLFDDNVDFSAFESDEEESKESKELRDQERQLEDQKWNNEFWRLLKDDRDKIKQLDGYGELSGGVRNLEGDGASIFVRAKDLGNGSWQLFIEKAPIWQKAYLLNYAGATVTGVKRSKYEEDHDFFLTVALSGCRFTLTETHVLHIAADAGAGSAGRDSAENAKLVQLNAVPGRKRSVSVTSRDNSILYHPAPAAALAHIAQREAIAAMSGKMLAGTNIVQIAQEATDGMRERSAAEPAVLQAAEKLEARINGKVDANSSVVAICDAFRLAVTNQIVNACNIKKGAFVIGLKDGATWKYHVLANGVWSEILPG